ncbi:MAG: zinc dependent phospholipase C family protein [Chitinophagales bacterium]|nr:zinc dependent phospholipase C family protein [Bacteroidota bacterium]MCB9043802.1 zinc dependent phospholipase C family protein [Chitinophagales bacterium]
MKKKLLIVIAFALGVVFFVYNRTQSNAWGFWAHQRINRLAVFTLPPEMIVFYKYNIEYITEHAVDPDKRRYASDNEAPRHYIDIDHYDTYPFTAVPHRWNDAVAKYTEDTLVAYGIVPWHIEVMLKRLTSAFEKGNPQEILRVSADFGHYIADSHVPLHTTHNYNGQLTNQKGIHGFWESRLPELFADNYDYFVGKAEYIKNVNEFVWDRVLESAAATDSVLYLEAKLNKLYPSDQKYGFEERNNITTRTYSAEYSSEYHQMLDDMVERRMRRAILSVGSLWYTAWVDAGKPDISNLGEYIPTEEDMEEQKELDNLYSTGKIKGREHED